MKKKVIESARRFIKKLFEEILDRESFVFEAPKSFTRNFSRDMLTDDQLEVIDDWKIAVRGQINTAEKLARRQARPGRPRRHLLRDDATASTQHHRHVR